MYEFVEEETEQESNPIPPTEDEVREHNLGTAENPRPIFLSALLGEEETAEYMRLLQEFSDVFAWSYAEMPGLDPEVAMHRLNIREDAKPVKQPQRKFHPAIMEKIEKEVQKLKDVGFIREEQHPDWLANIVPVTMKNGQILVCIDFRNLNDACPKPFPITEIMIYNTLGYERMSFMDGFSGYNQIKMHPEDQKHTSFRTPFGVYCYTVMPFGLKNAGAPYVIGPEGHDQDLQGHVA